MTLDENEIQKRLRLGEESRLEFKAFEFRGNRPLRPDRKSIADEPAAFVNTQGGVMSCGVTDSGEIQAMTRDEIDALEALVGPPRYRRDQAVHRSRDVACGDRRQGATSGRGRRRLRAASQPRGSAVSAVQCAG